MHAAVGRNATMSRKYLTHWKGWCRQCSARLCFTSCGLMIRFLFLTSSRSSSSTSSLRQRSGFGSAIQDLNADTLDRMHAFVKPLLDRWILKPLEIRRTQYCWPINPSFKKGLRNALTGLYVRPVRDRVQAILTRCPCSGTSNSFGVPYERGPDDPSPDVDELFDYGEETWEVGRSGGVSFQTMS